MSVIKVSTEVLIIEVLCLYTTSRLKELEVLMEESILPRARSSTILKQCRDPWVLCFGSVRIVGARKGGPRCRTSKIIKVYSKQGHRAKTEDATKPDIKNTKR